MPRTGGPAGRTLLGRSRASGPGSLRGASSLFRIVPHGTGSWDLSSCHGGIRAEPQTGCPGAEITGHCLPPSTLTSPTPQIGLVHLLHILSPLVRKARIRSANLKIQGNFRYLLLLFGGLLKKRKNGRGNIIVGGWRSVAPRLGGGGVNGCCSVSEDTC